MTDAEFNAISQRIAAVFPSLANWYHGLPAEAKAAQRDRRKSCFRSLAVADIEAAIDELATAPECPWGRYGEEEWACARIADKAREIASKRSYERQNEPYRRTQPRANSTVSMWDLMEKLRGLKNGGACHPGEEPAILDSLVPDSNAHDGYRCDVCLDMGTVVCVSMLRRTRTGGWWFSTCVARCVKCDAGSEIAKMKLPPPDYSKDEHVRIRPTASGAEAAEAVRAFIEKRKAAKRVAEFDKFNELQQAAST